MKSAVVPSGITPGTRTRLPATIVTGFLGSGKTTLSNHILASQPGLRIAVMVTEIGEIGIDGDLIVASENAMLELSNGCICCSINNDLVGAIFRVLVRGNEIDQLIVESSGLSDPLPIILTFLRSEFRGRVRVDAIIAVADAANFCLDLFDSAAAFNQLRYADVVLLNKCDLAGAEYLASIEAQIRKIRGNARVLRTTRSAVPLRLILDTGLFRRDQLSTEEAGHSHLSDDGFGSASFASKRPFAVHKFQNFLNAELPDGLFRGKGFCGSTRPIGNISFIW